VGGGGEGGGEGERAIWQGTNRTLESGQGCVRRELGSTHISSRVNPIVCVRGGREMLSTFAQPSGAERAAARAHAPSGRKHKEGTLTLETGGGVAFEEMGVFAIKGVLCCVFACAVSSGWGRRGQRRGRARHLGGDKQNIRVRARLR